MSVSQAFFSLEQSSIAWYYFLSPTTTYRCLASHLAQNYLSPYYCPDQPEDFTLQVTRWFLPMLMPCKRHPVYSVKWLAWGGCHRNCAKTDNTALACYFLLDHLSHASMEKRWGYICIFICSLPGIVSGIETVQPWKAHRILNSNKKHIRLY